VNAQTRKPTAQAKVQKKPAAKAKTPAKPLAKPAAKAATRSAPRPLTKAKTAPAKPTIKAATKSAAKPVAKTAAKAPAKSAVKATAKPASKVAPKVTPKPVAKPAVKTSPKAPVILKSPVSPAAKAASPASKAVAKAPAAPLKAPPPPVPAPAVAVAPAAKPGRPSARLASITVPSMAPAVASTAAKASYSQTQSAPVVHPLPHVAAKKDPKLANNWKTKTADQLSDAEVIAMPDTEYMNEKQLAFFRLKLVTLKRDILNNAGETTEHLREDTVVVPDPADRATIEEEHALELRTRDRERKLLKKIEQSIAQIDAGEYGYCDETGEPIGVGRLLARPTATLSLEAQQRRELKQKMFGD
jgi:DnaK suppressor protein